MRFLGTMFAVALGMIIARNLSPVIDYGSRRFAIRILNARAQAEADRRAAAWH